MNKQILKFSSAVALLLNSSSAKPLATNPKLASYGTNGITGPAPCLEGYSINYSSPETGTDQHFVHGFESKDKSIVTVGSGFEVRKGGSGRVALAIKKGQWQVQLGDIKLSTEANWAAESADGSYIIVGGFIEKASNKMSDFALWKLDSKTGAVLWEMVYADTIGVDKSAAVESVAFAPDGGLIVGGFMDGITLAASLKFKSAGQPEEGLPFVGKISASDVNGSTAPSKFEWTYTEKDPTQLDQYRGSTKALRIADNGDIYALSGYRTTINKIDQNGKLIKCSGQIDWALQSSDLELAPDGGVVIAGLTGYTSFAKESWGIRTMGYVVKVDKDFNKVWTKNYGDSPYGINQFAGLESFKEAVIDECWGLMATTSSSGAQDGYAIACGTGTEGCGNCQPNTECMTKCEQDPRTVWRSYVVAFDEEGTTQWERMDSFQGATKPADPTTHKVKSSAAEYIFPMDGGKIGVITDEAQGMGFLTMSAPNGQQCSEVPQYFGSKSQDSYPLSDRQTKEAYQKEALLLEIKYDKELKIASGKAMSAWSEPPTLTFLKLKHAAEHVKALKDWATAEEKSSYKADWKPSDKKPEPILTAFIAPVAEPATTEQNNEDDEEDEEDDDQNELAQLQSSGRRHHQNRKLAQQTISRLSDF